MKLKIKENNKEKYVNVDFWSYMKFHVSGFLLIQAVIFVLTFIALIGLE